MDSVCACLAQEQSGEKQKGNESKSGEYLLDQEHKIPGI